MSSFPLFLMRHGEPELGGCLLGHGDVSVTEAGLQACVVQAAGLAIEQLVTSDLRRAAACAEAIGRPRRDPRWRELDFGAWDGKRAAELDQTALTLFWQDPDAYHPPGGERWSALVGRVGAAIDALDPVATLVVTHGGPIRAALHRLCGFTLEQAWTVDLPCAVVLGLRVWEGPPRRAQMTALWP